MSFPAIELYNRPCRFHRNHSCHSKLDSLLNDELHLIPLGQAHVERDLILKLSVCLLSLKDVCKDLIRKDL